MQVLARLRWALARHPLLYWGAVAALAAVVGVLAASAAARVDRARLAWGRQVTVLVVDADTRAGTVVHATARRYPAAMVPSSATRALPAAAVARHDLAAGEVLVAVDLTAPGVAGRVPRGDVAIDIPVADTTGLAAGTPVVVFSGGQRVADGVVVTVSAQHAMVAVAAGDGAAVSLAAAQSGVVVALRG